MTLIVDRFEDQYVICEGDERKMFAIPKEEAPEGLAEGDVLNIDDEGNLTKDEAATKARRDAINEKRKKLMK